MAESLDFRITAQDLASAKFAGVNQNLTGMKGVAAKASGALTGLGIVGFAGATLAAAGLTSALADSIHEAIADEESVNRLAASLRANIPAWDGNTKEIEKNITAKQRLGFQDEELRNSLTVLAGATHDVGRAQEIQNTAMDLARFKGIDLQTASEALIKVEGGHYRSLAQLGIKLREGATSSEALAAVQKVAAGQAEAFGKTTAGAAAAAGIAFDELKEDIGRQLMPVLLKLAQWVRSDLIPAIRSIGIGIGKVSDFIGDIGASVSALGIDFGDMGDRVHSIADKVGIDFDAVKQKIVDNMLDAGMSFKDAADKAERDFGLMGTSAGRLQLGMEQLPPGIKRVMSMFSGAVKEGTGAAVKDMGEVVPDMADAMLAGQQKLKDAGAQLVKFMQEALSPAQIVSRNQGFLASAELATGLASNNPFVKQKAAEMRDAALLEIQQMGGIAASGTAIGATWTQNIAAGIGANTYRIINQLNYIRPLLEGFSPPKKGPFKNIDRWGFNVGRAWSESVAEGIGPLNLPVPKVGGIPVGSMGVGGLTMPAASAGGASGGGGGLTVIFQSTFPPSPGQADDLARQLLPAWERERQRQGLS